MTDVQTEVIYVNPDDTRTISAGSRGKAALTVIVTGPQGASGLMGPPGEDGDDSWVPGPQGVPGPVGPAGPMGPTGEEGDDSWVPGPQGVPGPLGPPGPMGPSGQPLTTNSMSLPANTNVPAGFMAFVTDSLNPINTSSGTILQGGGAYFVPVYNDGFNWILWAGGTQGPVGPPGPVGSLGPQGPVYAGIPGEDGDDAWTMPIGQAGPQGQAGSIGPQGVVGAAGVPGEDGDDAWTVIAGQQGPQGAAGAQGVAGGQGPVYAGIPGEDGDDAWTVIAGQQGPQGAPGANGAPGTGGVGFPGMDGADGDDAWPAYGPNTNTNISFTNATVLGNLVFSGTAIKTTGSLVGGSGYTAGSIPLTFGSITGGSGYVTGTYTNVATTTSGGGTGLTATVIVDITGKVAAFMPNNASATGYAVSDTVSVSNANLGGSGSGLSIPVNSVGYTGVSLTGGTGSGAVANITVSAGGAVTVCSVTTRGTGYAVNDVLSASAANIGGTGSGFTVTVTALTEIQISKDSYLWDQATSLSGSAISGAIPQVSPYNILIQDTMDTNGTNMIGLSLETAPSAGHNGGRTAIQGYCAVVGTPANIVPAGYVGLLGLCRVSANLTGTSGAFVNYLGSVFGGNSNVYSTYQATYMALMTAHEFDVSLAVGSSAARKNGILIVQAVGDYVRGVYEDGAIVIGNQDASSTTWLNGLLFGGYGEKWAFGTDSTLIGVQARVVGAASPPVALNGVDFSAVTFQTGGYAYRSTGFGVDGPTGNVLLNTGVTLQYNADTIVGRAAAANLMLGAADAAAPVAQTLSVQNVATGTSNTSGVNWTLSGSRGTGTGLGGKIILQVAPSGASSSNQNPLVNALTINSGGVIWTGNTATVQKASNTAVTPLINASSANSASKGLGATNYAASTTAPATLYLSQSNTNSITTQVAVISGSQLGAVTADGSDGTNFQDSSQIRFDCDGTVAANNVPGRIVFSTNPPGTTTNLTEAMRIDSSQNVTIKTGTYSSSPTTGALVVTGGIGTSSTITAVGPITSINGFFVYDNALPVNWQMFASNGFFNIANNQGGTLLQVDLAGDLLIPSTTNSPGVGYGALVVGGGASIGGQLNVQQGATVTGGIKVSGAPVTLAQSTVAGLPPAGSSGAGSLMVATDVTFVGVSSPIGGGSNKAIVYSDGNIWLPTNAQYRPFRNILMNGSFDVWQRGAGDSSVIAVGASTTSYTVDRWYLTTGATEACTVSAHTSLANKSRLCARVQRTNGQTGTAKLIFGYPLTADECKSVAGQLLALQFLASTGANWSAGTLTCDVYFGTGTNGKRGGGFTNETHPISISVVLSASSGTIQVTGNSGTTTVGTNVTQGEVQFTFTPIGTAGVNDYVDLDNVQLEEGNVNTEYAYLPFLTVLSDCKRHFRKTFRYSVAPATATGDFAGSLTSYAPLTNTALVNPWIQWQFPESMIASPVVTTYNPGAANANWRNQTASTDITVSVDPPAAKSADGVFIGSTAITSTGNQGDICCIHATADAGL